MPMVYMKRAGARYKVDPQVLGETLERLMPTDGSPLKPETVVEDSRSPDAPLHGEFIWDDAIAAADHRRQRAYYLMRNVVVVETEIPKSPAVGPIIVVSPLKVPLAVETGGYERETVKSDPVLRAARVKQGLERLLGFWNEYSDFEEFDSVRAAIARTLQSNGVPYGRGNGVPHGNGYGLPDRGVGTTTPGAAPETVPPLA